MRWTLAEWRRDLRHAARALRRVPGYTAVAATTLALAIGAGAGLFSVVDTVLLDPLPYEEMDRLVAVAASAPGSDFPEEFGVSAEFYLQYKERSQLLEDVAVYNSFTSTLRVGDRVERVRMAVPTNSLYSTLGVRPLLGRLPTAADENGVVVISHQLWQSWFGGDPAVLGSTPDVSGEPRTVIGVMPPDFRFPNDGTLLWISNEVRAEGLRTGRYFWDLVARRKPDATPEALATELTALSCELPERFGGTPAYARLIAQHRAVVRPLQEELLGEYSRPLWVLLAAAAIVLLIACANVANLFLVRAESRQRDLALRRAIGAGRGQLVRLQLAEAVVVAGLAAILALGVAAVLLPLLIAAAPAGIPRLDEAGMRPATLLFTFLAALGSALACGLVPAWRASAPDLTRLREGGRGSTHRRRWARQVLVAGQTALALVLLIGSGLLLRSFEELQSVDPGYDTRDVFTFQMAPDRPALHDGPTYARFQLDFLDRLAALPGVRSVGLVENVPLNESPASDRAWAEGRESGAGDGTLISFTFAAGDYFGTMGIDLLGGRTFGVDDHLATPGNAVVSRTAAAQLWPGEDPLGRRFRLETEDAWMTVVGVVDDVLQDSFRDRPQPLVYLPLAGPTPESWTVSSPAYVVQTSRAETIAPEVRALVREVAPEAPMYRVFTLDGLARDSMVQLRFTLLLLAIGSSLALVLGAVGLYGVLSYVVAERAREIGVRMALGARKGQVRRMVVSQGARVVVVGIVVGLAVALASTRALGGLLYGVEPFDATIFLAMSVSMVLIGLLASYLPALRASRVDPALSLRGE
jgi:predicted permease